MLKFLAAAVVSSSLLLAGPQDCPKGQDCSDADSTATSTSEVREIDGKQVRVIFKKKETIDMVGADLLGEIKRPRIIFVPTRGGDDFPVMLPERASFKSELIQSMEKI